MRTNTTAAEMKSNPIRTQIPIRAATATNNPIYPPFLDPHSTRNIRKEQAQNAPIFALQPDWGI